MKTGYITNIEHKTLENTHFRHVLYTGKNLQVVVMSLQPGEDIGKEVHEDNDQFIRIEAGSGMAFIDGNETSVSDDDIVVIPAGSEHNIINTGDAVLKLYTVYGPPEHRDGVVHETRTQAEEQHDADHFDGVTSE